MSLEEAEWGYCRHCHRDVETRKERLITHGQGMYTAGCTGSGQKPTKAPPEGTAGVMTVPPERPAAAEPPVPASTSAMRWTWAAFRGREDRHAAG